MMNKLQKAIYESHKNSYKIDLYDCYENCSVAKRRAYSNCVLLCNELNGYDLRIVSHNKNMFTVGFKYETEDGIRMFMYITPTQKITFSIEEVENG